MMSSGEGIDGSRDVLAELEKQINADVHNLATQAVGSDDRTVWAFACLNGLHGQVCAEQDEARNFGRILTTNKDAMAIIELVRQHAVAAEDTYASRRERVALLRAQVEASNPVVIDQLSRLFCLCTLLDSASSNTRLLALIETHLVAVSDQSKDPECRAEIEAYTRETRELINKWDGESEEQQIKLLAEDGEADLSQQYTQAVEALLTTSPESFTVQPDKKILEQIGDDLSAPPVLQAAQYLTQQIALESMLAAGAREAGNTQAAAKYSAHCSYYYADLKRIQEDPSSSSTELNASLQRERLMNHRQQIVAARLRLSDRDLCALDAIEQLEQFWGAAYRVKELLDSHDFVAGDILTARDSDRLPLSAEYTFYVQLAQSWENQLALIQTLPDDSSDFAQRAAYLRKQLQLPKDALTQQDSANSSPARTEAA